MDADKRIADRARAAGEHLADVRQRLRREQAMRSRALAKLTGSRRHIGAMLAQRQQLLRSVQAEVAAIQAREARKQAAERAAAQARLERERRQPRLAPGGCARFTPRPRRHELLRRRTLRLLTLRRRRRRCRRPRSRTPRTPSP